MCAGSQSWGPVRWCHCQWENNKEVLVQSLGEPFRAHVCWVLPPHSTSVTVPCSGSSRNSVGSVIDTILAQGKGTSEGKRLPKGRQ